ncbi:MAG: AMP-binding protein, partial [Holophagales bacterium]|nr:AMP-binding protein [Holophagales bacterium]
GPSVEGPSVEGHDSGGELRLEADPDAVAHLQATSGSTGNPKLAVLRHSHLSANVRGIGEAIGERPGDRVVSWLPLYHDMGLVCLSCVLYWQRPLVLADPSSFVRHPINGWLKLISRFRGTISPAPTSAYQICSRLARRVRTGDLDLSSWRVGFCGAEPVHESVLENFSAAFCPHGLAATTLLPVYGLAECTLAATIPPRGRTYHVERVARRALADGRAKPAPGGSAQGGVAMVSVGAPLPGHELRIVDGERRPLPERRVGEIELRGPSTIDGYWRDGTRRRHAFLRTGDLGYVSNGQLFVTGRRKEIIICYGRNLPPSEVEAVVAGVLDDPLHQGVAAFGVPNAATGSEDLHVMIEHRKHRAVGRQAEEEGIRDALLHAFEVGGAHIHWVEKGRIPKTTSGKIMRYRCRQLVTAPAESAPAGPVP